MIDGNKIELRKATVDDLSEIKRIADQHKNELGFILRPILARAIEFNEVIIAKCDLVIGFVSYHHRKDKVTTLHNIVVVDGFKGNGIGKKLFITVVKEAKTVGNYAVRLKAPADLPANHFYEEVGCELVFVEKGKHRELNVWEIKV